jgi:hypothetical protein
VIFFKVHAHYRHAKLAANLTADEFESITYSYIGENPHRNMFSINPSSGALETSVLIDRETITDCNDIADCRLQLNFVASSAKTNFVKLITVSIQILDINDHAPSFPQGIFKLNISESVPVNSRFTIPAAIDKDTGNNAIIGYDIYPDNGSFALNFTKKLDGSFLVQLVLKSQLNRENKEFYELSMLKYLLIFSKSVCTWLKWYETCPFLSLSGSSAVTFKMTVFGGTSSRTVKLYIS